MSVNAREADQAPAEPRRLSPGAAYRAEMDELERVASGYLAQCITPEARRAVVRLHLWQVAHARRRFQVAKAAQEWPRAADRAASGRWL